MAVNQDGLVRTRHLGNGLVIDESRKKINVAIDGSSITFNDQGQLVAKTGPTNVTQVTQLAASQFIQQTNNFSFIELKETPAFNTGLEKMEIGEVTGYRDFEVTGLASGSVPLNLQQFAVIFPYDYDHFGVVDLSCEVFQVNGYGTRSFKGFGAPIVEVRKELSIARENPDDPNSKHAAVWFSVVTKVSGLAEGERIKLRMQCKARAMGKYPE